MAATIIGIDPHKESWTAVAVDPRGQKLASVRAPVTEAGYRQLRRFADRYQEPVWAIEGAYGLGAHLSALLAGDGVTAWDVPAKLAARVRVLSSGHCRKSDEDDALSVAVAATTSTKLRRVHTDPAATELKVLIESDAVFAVKQSLVEDFVENSDPDLARQYGVAAPFMLANFDIELHPEAPPHP